MQHFRKYQLHALHTIFQYNPVLIAFFQRYLLFVELEIMMLTKSRHQLMLIHVEKRHTVIHT